MRLAADFTRLLAHPVLAALLVVAVVALPLAGVVGCPVEEVGPDDTDADDAREVELTVAGTTSESPVPSAPRAAHTRRPPTHARQLPLHPSLVRSPAAPLSPPLRC